MMDRLVWEDAAWDRMAPFIIGRPDQKGSTGRDNRMVVESVWDHAGSPWRDVPEGPRRNSVFRRFSRWSRKRLVALFAARSDDPDFASLIVASTIALLTGREGPAHRAAEGRARRGGSGCSGRRASGRWPDLQTPF